MAKTKNKRPGKPRGMDTDLRRLIIGMEIVDIRRVSA